jgi:hypothetical protein
MIVVCKKNASLELRTGAYHGFVLRLSDCIPLNRQMLLDHLLSHWLLNLFLSALQIFVLSILLLDPSHSQLHPNDTRPLGPRAHLTVVFWRNVTVSAILAYPSIEASTYLSDEV